MGCGEAASSKTWFCWLKAENQVLKRNQYSQANLIKQFLKMFIHIYQRNTVRTER